MYFDYAVPLALTVIGLLFMVAMIGLQKLLAPRNPFQRKLMPYECGEPPTGGAWINFNVRFYLIALVFVIFEVEVAFIYPVATVYLDWVRRGQRLRAQRGADFSAYPVHRLGLCLGQTRPRVDQKGA